MNPTMLLITREKAKAMIQHLVDTLDTPYRGSSSMTPSVYDTAWVAMVSKIEGQSRQWLFPQCFESILLAQGTDGGFGTFKTDVDTILNTAAALLAMCKHRNTLMPTDKKSNYHLSTQIGKATAFLQIQLNGWDVEQTHHVGFEVLIPRLLHMLSDEGLRFRFPGFQRLLTMAESKMSRFSPSALYSQQSNTLVHSLEALIGYVDFDKVSHHIHNGAMMASPSATAAYLIHSTVWNDEAEAYLRFVVEHGNGKVTSAFPISIFEIAWVLSTLLDHGFSVESLGNNNVSKLANFLENELHNRSQIVGFAPGLLPDADDTAKAILTMNLLGRPTHCSKMIETFEGASHFRTYANESGPSFSANCNVVIALARSPEASQYGSKIQKALQFLNQRWAEGEIKDKWNQENHYSIMLFTRAISDLLKLYDSNELPPACTDPAILSSFVITTMQVCVRTLSSQDNDGSWKSSCEVSAYALLTLKTLASLPWIQETVRDEVSSSINCGEIFLKAQEARWKTPAIIWIEKVSYGSKVLSETYCLAALNASATYIWLNRVTALTNTPMRKVKKFSLFFSHLPLFSEEPMWRIRASVAEGYMMADTLHDTKARAVFPQAVGSKYVEYIPLTWTICNNANGFGISTQTMREMMIISLLNFQADKYLEDVLADRDLQCDFLALRAVVSHILSQYSSKTPSTHQSNCEELRGVPPESTHMIHSQEKGGTNFVEKDPSSEHAQPLLLANFSETMRRFISYIQDHAIVARSSRSSRHLVTAQLLNFLHAHITQGEDNLKLIRQDSSYEQSSILADSQTTFYNWVNSTSAAHTSCPYSFEFFQCLIAPIGQSCLQNVTAMYISQDLCRHLASMCRIYNDYGSIIRDRKEGNLNSVNFPEFHTHSGSWHTNEKGVGDVTTDEILRERLMQLAAYERTGVDTALLRLKSETNLRTWKAMQVFVKVTDLYGQIYVVKDINNGSTN